MRTKIRTLGLICIFIFSYCKSPVSSNSSEFLEDTLTINYFMANPANITLGKSSVLSWEVMNATKVSIDNGIGGVPLIGEIEIHPLETIVYKLTASKNIETLTASCELIVDQNVACVVMFEGPNYKRHHSGVFYYGAIKNIGLKIAYQTKLILSLYRDGKQVGGGRGYLFQPIEKEKIKYWEEYWSGIFWSSDLELRYTITWEE